MFSLRIFEKFNRFCLTSVHMVDVYVVIYGVGRFNVRKVKFKVYILVKTLGLGG